MKSYVVNSQQAKSAHFSSFKTYSKFNKFQTVPVLQIPAYIYIYIYTHIVIICPEISLAFLLALKGHCPFSEIRLYICAYVAAKKLHPSCSWPFLLWNFHQPK